MTKWVLGCLKDKQVNIGAMLLEKENLSFFLLDWIRVPDLYQYYFQRFTGIPTNVQDPVKS